MKELKLIIPNTNDQHSWFTFIRNARQHNYSQIDNVIFDFNTCGFLDTGSLTMLACLIEDIHKQQCVSFSYINGSRDLNNHLDNIRFKEYWNKGFNRDAYTNSKNSTTLCLWHISANMIDTYGNQAQLFYKRQFFQYLDLQPFSSTLVEMFNNVFNHSDSVVDGYVLTQYFPNIHRMSFSVCDFGKGIPTSINNYKTSINENPYSPDSYAIQESLVAGISSKSIPQNAGLGLSNVFDFSENTNGIISIYSNGGSFTKKSGENPVLKELRIPYDGTLVTLNIDTQCFENFDPAEEIYGFN